MAAVVEQHHDDNGIIWPMSVAPYHVIVTLVNTKDQEQVKVAEDIYTKLEKAGIEVLLDDRDERAGVKFKDADLLGIPVRITVGKKVSEGMVEYKLRRDTDKIDLTVEDAVERAVQTVLSEK